MLLGEVMLVKEVRCAHLAHIRYVWSHQKLDREHGHIKNSQEGSIHSGELVGHHFTSDVALEAPSSRYCQSDRICMAYAWV